MTFSIIKSIILDLDGTLLNSRKEVSPRNSAAILECYKKGYHIIFATARPPRTVRKFLPEELLRLGYVVYYNGANIVNESKSLNEYISIDTALAGDIIDHCTRQHHACVLSVEHMDQWYCHQQVDLGHVTNITEAPKVIEIEGLKKLDAAKIILTGFADVPSLMAKFKESVHILVTDGGELIQIMSKRASKELAIAKICELEGIGLEETLVLGDDYNDLGLFQLCGYPVAMGNAIQELKDIAKEVTETNDNDGVAVVLERLQ